MSGPKLWVTGDWNAFFGFGINVLVNLLVLIGLLRAVLGVPETLILTRILPAVGVTMGLSCFYYAWLAWRLAQRTGRSDVCALPSGISVPHMFVVVTVVMLPVLRATGDFMQAWGAGLAWVFVQSFVLIGGGLIGPFLRRITPRAALLGSLTGVSLTFIAMGPAAQIFSAPLIGLPCLAILIASWLGKVRFPGGVPGGLVAMAAGTLVFWMVRASGLQIDGLGSVPPFPAALDFSPHLPAPALALLRGGLGHLDLILVTAIPFGLYDLVEGLDNVESAAAGGDSYPTVRVLAADGLVSLLGCLIGNPFINAVYIGHPGWKAMGGRIGYAAGTGAMVIALTCFGLVAGALALVPTVAILPTLLYVGMLIGAQAFHESPRRHAPALVLALIPPIAAWGKGQIDMALAAAGTSAAAVGTAALGGNGVLYHGLAILGSGATLAGIILASIVAMVIDRRFLHAAGFALAGAVFTFCGVIHGEEVRLAASPQLAFGYALVAVILCLCARLNRADEIIGS